MENRSLVIKKKNGTFNPKFRLYSSTKIAKRLKNRNNQVTKNYILCAMYCNRKSKGRTKRELVILNIIPTQK